MSGQMPKVRPHPEVVDTALDETEVALLHLETKTYYSLNLTGARIWQGLKQGLELEAISERLQQEFEVDAADAERSVRALIEDLAQHRLVQIQG